MRIRLSLGKDKKIALLERLHQAYVIGHLRLIKRIHGLLDIADGKSVAQVAETLNLSEQSVRNYVTAFIVKGLNSLVYRRPPGRPPKLTKTQRKQL